MLIVVSIFSFVLKHFSTYLKISKLDIEFSMKIFSNIELSIFLLYFFSIILFDLFTVK